MQTLDKLMPKILDVLAHEKNAYITLERASFSSGS
jgi:hypothetical protein